MLMVWMVFLLMQFCTRFTLYSTNGSWISNVLRLWTWKIRWWQNIIEIFWLELSFRLPKWRRNDPPKQIALPEWDCRNPKSWAMEAWFAVISVDLQLGITYVFKLKKTMKNISLLKIIFLFCTVNLSLGLKEYDLSWFRRNHLSISGITEELTPAIASAEAWTGQSIREKHQQKLLHTEAQFRGVTQMWH